MSSINTQQHRPYTTGYEQPATQKPGPIRYEDSAEAAQKDAAQGNSAPANGQMTPEQRGSFSSHRGIVNPKQSQAATQDQLAELSASRQI